MKITTTRTPHRHLHYVASAADPDNFVRQRSTMPVAWPPARIRITRWWTANHQRRTLLVERPGIHPQYLGKLVESSAPGIYGGTVGDKFAGGFLIVQDKGETLTVRAYPDVQLYGPEARAFTENEIDR